MRQIAESLGVSVTTVSHALSGKRPVRPELVERVRAAALTAGFTPNAAAQSLNSKKRGLIGLAVPSIINPSLGRIAIGVERVMSEADYGVVIVCTSRDDRRQVRRYLNLLRNHTIDGLIYTAGRELSFGDEILTLAETHPVVFADEPIADVANVPSVTSADFDGGRLAGEHLRSLGHERAVIIAGPSELSSTKARVGGFQTHFPNALVVHGDFEFDSGLALTADLIASQLPFTCIFACSDEMAIGSIHALEIAGLDVPRDISVVGYDDIPTARFFRPALTTIRQDMDAMGVAAAEMLLEVFRAPASAASLSRELEVALFVRQSTSVAGALRR